MADVSVEAITVAMAVAPGVYSRNRFFELFQAPEIRRARRRAAVIQSVVRHFALLGDSGMDLGSAVTIERAPERVVFRYRVPRLAMGRRVELSPLEASCVLFLSHRAKLTGLAPSDIERQDVMQALSTLAGGALAMLAAPT
jgi:hypothetical protein